MIDEPEPLLRRASVLKACRNEPQSRRELETITDRSRATIYRATTELDEEGLLSKHSHGYQTTPKGQALSYAIEAFVKDIDNISRLEPLLDRIDHPELLEKAHLLSDADITVADDDNMYRANDRVLEYWDETDTVRAAMASSGSRLCLEKSVSMAVEQEMDVEMCFPPDVFPSDEHLNNGSFDAATLFDEFETYISESVPFTFLLCDDRAVVAAHNDIGIPTAVAETDDPIIYQWLESQYERIREEARPLEECSPDSVGRICEPG